MAKLYIGCEYIFICKNGTVLLHHFVKLGVGWALVIRGEKSSFLYIMLLSGKDCKCEITIKLFDLGHNFDTFE